MRLWGGSAASLPKVGRGRSREAMPHSQLERYIAAQQSPLLGPWLRGFRGFRGPRGLRGFCGLGSRASDSRCPFTARAVLGIPESISTPGWSGAVNLWDQ